MAKPSDTWVVKPNDGNEMRKERGDAQWEYFDGVCTLPRCGFTSHGHSSKKKADDRMKEHYDEHMSSLDEEGNRALDPETGESVPGQAMREIAEWNTERGV